MSDKKNNVVDRRTGLDRRALQDGDNSGLERRRDIAARGGTTPPVPPRKRRELARFGVHPCESINCMRLAAGLQVRNS